MKLIIECTAEECAELLKLKTGESKGAEKSNNLANACLEKDWYMKFFSSPNYD